MQDILYEIDLSQSANKIAKTILENLRERWKNTLPKLHPFYKEKIPLDGGYRDAYTAALYCFCKRQKDNFTNLQLSFAQRILNMLMDPPSEFADIRVFY